MGTINLITPDYGVDATSTLQTQINSEADGTAEDPTVFVLPAKTIQMDGTLNIEKRAWVQLRGTPGSTILKTEVYGNTNGGVNPSTRRHVRIRGSHDVVVAGFRVEGPHVVWDGSGPNEGYLSSYDPLYEFEHAFSISPFGNTNDSGIWWDCYNILIEDVQSYAVGGDHVYVSTATAGSQGNRHNIDPSNIHVRRTVSELCGRQGFGIVGGFFMVFEDNVVFCTRTAFDLENISGEIGYVWILNNWAWSKNGLVNGQSSNIDLSHIYVRGNICRDMRLCWANGASPGRVDWQLWNNVVTGPPGDYATSERRIMRFGNIDKVSVRGNYERMKMNRTHVRPQNSAVLLTDDMGYSFELVGNDFTGSNQLLETETGEVPATVSTVAGNVGIWEGEITPSFAPYPGELDPDLNRAHTVSMYPQLDPPQYNVAHHWDALPKGTGRDNSDPVPFTALRNPQNLFFNGQVSTPRSGSAPE